MKENNLVEIQEGFYEQFIQNEEIPKHLKLNEKMNFIKSEFIELSLAISYFIPQNIDDKLCENQANMLFREFLNAYISDIFMDLK